MMIRILTGKSLLKLLKAAYERGMIEGSQHGYKMSRADRSNRGVVLGSMVDKEIENIINQRWR